MSGAGAWEKRELRLDPAPARWSDLARARFAKLDARARRLREQLKLPVDRPVIMTGHQATWWHAGILAKFVAAGAAAEAAGGACAWICPDQDERDFSTLRVPTRSDDDDRALRVKRARIGPEIGPGVAAASCGAFSPKTPALGGEAALPSVAQGVSRALAALQAHASKPTAAAQVMAALADLAAPVVAPAPMLFASRLHRTELFQRLVERIRSDPAAAARAYNSAIERAPAAGLAPMRQRRGEWETPLWRLARGAPRQRVFADELADIPLAELAPRAILMTGLLRLGACDLFVHGAGGERYDAAAEAWLAAWLGATLAPVAVATATLTLPLDDDGSVSAQKAKQARWRAHHARHNPAALGDEAAQERKRALIARIDALKEAGKSAGDVFRELHQFLADWRASHAAALRQLDEQADALARALAARAIIEDRTWPFFYHDESSLRALRDAIEKRFAPAAREAPCAAPP